MKYFLQDDIIRLKFIIIRAIYQLLSSNLSLICEKVSYNSFCTPFEISQVNNNSTKVFLQLKNYITLKKSSNLIKSQGFLALRRGALQFSPVLNLCSLM